MIRSKLAANVYAYRHFNNLTQDALASKSGVDKSQIGNIENQRTSTGIDIVEKLAIALRIDPCLLIARPILKMPGTGIKSYGIVPTFFTEGVAAYAFWTSEGMEFHPISNDQYRNALRMMALVQANGFTGKDLLDESKRLHIPYKTLLNK